MEQTLNIFESVPLMTAIDLIIIGLAAIAIASVRQLGGQIDKGYVSGPLGVALGIGLIAAFFAFDLATMWLLPAFLGAERSHALMVELHINWSWVVLLAASATLTAGLLQTARGLMRAQSRLQEQEGLYQSVLRGQDEYVVHWRPDGTRTFVNDAYCSYRRATAEELIGENFFPLIAEVDRERVRCKQDALTPERPEGSDSHRSVAPDGSIRWQEWSDRGIFDDGGRLVEVQSVGRDITDRRRIEEELENREQQYEAIFRASVHGITVRRLDDGELLKANPAMAEIFGYSVEEFMELAAEDYVHADSLHLYPHMLAAVRRGERFPFEARGIHRDGRELELEGYFIPFVYEGRQQILGLIEDVTERNLALRGLQESEARFRGLFEASPDAVLVTNIDGEVLDVNPAAVELYGGGRDELVGRPLWGLVGDEERAALERYEWSKRGEAVVAEGVSIRRSGATVPVTIRVNRFDYSGEPALLYCVTDNSERRKLEEQLRQSQKMEAVGQLAGGVAHDFNNLLTAILGYAELVEKATADDSSAQADIAEIRRAGEKAAALIGQLLAFSRQQVLRPRVLDLNEVVTDMGRLCRRTIGENVKLSTHLDPELPLVRVDRGQIEQVILNLAINARDAMPNGGELSFRTRNLVLDRPDSAHDVAVPAGEYVAMSVTDNGAGMSPETSRRVFEPFFTTKSPDQGTGLGLSMVYGIVNQSGGYIRVESEPDQGTTFEIVLPRAEGAAAGDEEPLVASIVAAERSVLLVDDNAPVRRIASRTLEDQGHQVVATGSAEEALELSRSRSGGFDLLLADFVLPRMDGVTLVEKIRAEHPETRVVLMSGYTRKVGVERQADPTGIVFLAKPFDRRGLLRAVATALRPRPSADRPSKSVSEVN